MTSKSLIGIRVKVLAGYPWCSVGKIVREHTNHRGYFDVKSDRDGHMYCLHVSTFRKE